MLGALNDASLCYNSVYKLRGKVEDISHAARLLEKAVALKPDDSTLMINAASQQWDLAVAQVTAGKLDPRIVRLGGRDVVLGYLYRDAAGREQVLGQLRQNPATAKAMQYFERGILLAPSAVRIIRRRRISTTFWTTSRHKSDFCGRFATRSPIPVKVSKIR